MRPETLAALLEPKLPEGPDICLSAGPLLGLGDHSVYSTLPERFSKLGYNVYLDKDTQPSNPEIGDLIWGHNPYIIGLSDKKPNAGYCNQGLFYEIANRLPGHRSIEAMERAHGLPAPYGKAPKIYYAPQPTKLNLAETILVDYSAVSSTLTRENIDEELRMMNSRFKNAPMLQILHPSWVALHQERVGGAGYQPASIFEYVDMIAACRAWIGSEAGGQSLAAAIRGEHDVYDDDARPEIVCKIGAQTHNSRGYTYCGVDYRETGNGLQAYWQPHENLVRKYEVSCAVRRIEMGERLATRG